MQICKTLEDGSCLCVNMDNCQNCKINRKDGIYNWIPVTERLPETNDNTLYRVIFRNCECYDLELGRSYFRHGKFSIPAEVILWRLEESAEEERENA